MKVGLLLEGGGMRGVFTAGVLDYWMERELRFPYILGISSGAWHATNYMSGQKGRARQISIDYANDPRAASYRNWLLKGGVLGLDFLFGEVPEELVPFNYEAFFQSEMTLVSVLTDADTGEALYYTNERFHDRESLKRMLIASISLPYVAKPVLWDGLTLFDGGVAEPLPLQKLLDEGMDRIVVVLNKEQGYRKKRSRWDFPAPFVYRRYPRFVDAIMQRYIKYNRVMEQLEQLEREGRVFLIQPSANLGLIRMERNPRKLESMYDLGFRDAQQTYDRLSSWLR